MSDRKRTSVSIPYYVWEELSKYFEEHQDELLKKGINSPSKLAASWIEESRLRAKALEDGYLKAFKK